MEVGEDFEASFGVWAGDNGFAAADDGKDRVNVRGGERVEVGAIVGGSGDSFWGLRGVRRGYGVWGGKGGVSRGMRDEVWEDIHQQQFSLCGIPRGRLALEQ